MNQTKEMDLEDALTRIEALENQVKELQSHIRN